MDEKVLPLSSEIRRAGTFLFHHLYLFQHLLKSPAVVEEKHMADLKEAVGCDCMYLKYTVPPLTPYRIAIMTSCVCLFICILLKCLHRHGLIRHRALGA